MNLRLSTAGRRGGAAPDRHIDLRAKQDASAQVRPRSCAKALPGRAAGQPVSCIPNYRGSGTMQVIDDYTILFREAARSTSRSRAADATGLETAATRW